MCVYPPFNLILITTPRRSQIPILQMNKVTRTITYLVAELRFKPRFMSMFNQTCLVLELQSKVSSLPSSSHWGGEQGRGVHQWVWQEKLASTAGGLGDQQRRGNTLKRCGRRGLGTWRELELELWPSFLASSSLAEPQEARGLGSLCGLG